MGSGGNLYEVHCGTFDSCNQVIEHSNCIIYNSIVSLLRLTKDGWELLILGHHHLWLNIYRKVPVVGKLDFELWRCKVKISQNMVPRLILRLHVFWNLQSLLSKLLEGHDVKMVLHINIDFWIVIVHQYFAQIPKL